MDHIVEKVKKVIEEAEPGIAVKAILVEEVPIPEQLPVNPESLRCPFCGVLPGRECVTSSGISSLVHVARIKVAAAIDRANTIKQ